MESVNTPFCDGAGGFITVFYMKCACGHSPNVLSYLRNFVGSTAVSIFVVALERDFRVSHEACIAIPSLTSHTLTISHEIGSNNFKSTGQHNGVLRKTERKYFISRENAKFLR